ncbi:phenoloxidase-activating factor 2-like [Chrysoperla carnea]|uniref:phenoloxidase-activating factor 2-like n=1 Tax=Chrysoperla carnea TaxID=189513 RepID=UPI001D072140|nr:phenoloxidase-activating factor 2-like [Chrysoperla carnea]
MKLLILVICIALPLCIYGQGSLDDLVKANKQRTSMKPRAAAGDEDDLDSLIEDVFNINPPASSTATPDRIGGNTNLNPGGNTNLNPSPSNPGGEGVNTGERIGDCECVPYYLCKNNTIITDGEGLLDIRMKPGPCKSYFDVCCTLANKLPLPITTPKPPQKPSGCGVRNPEGVGFRITGDKDNEAQFGEFPWMVAILREDTVDGKTKFNIYQCGGSLIHPRVVLTAAHCVSDPAKHASLKVRAGEWDTQTTNELYPNQDRAVESVEIHPDYYAGALFNDIALLFLKDPVDIAENVDVVCLPPDNVQIDKSRCFASGWGKDVFGQEGRYQVILKKIELPIVPRPQCVEALRNTRLGKHFQLHESFICAGGEPGKDTCKGDGGSPLICPIQGKPNQFQQVGIVAWGIGCGENQTPGVYVNVPLFRAWIDETFVFKNIERTFYTY